MKNQQLRPRQVQLFMPTLGTISTAMYVSGIDPRTKVTLPIARGGKERSRQWAWLCYWKKDEWPHVRETLISWGRSDLIGKKKHHLVPPGPMYGAWQ